MLIKVGPRANAVGCTLDPTRLLGAPHCKPLINLGAKGVFRATGRASTLRRLQDARFQAQSSGITIDGIIQGNTIRVLKVGGGAPAPRAPIIIQTDVGSARPARSPTMAKGKKAGSVRRADVGPQALFGLPSIGGILRRGIDIATDFIPVPGAGSIVRDLLKDRKRGGPIALPGAPPIFAGPVQVPTTTPVQLPPTPSITTPAERSMGTEFQAVVGAFDMPAIAPFAEQRVVLDCPPGMVLGKDNLCYPSAVLRRNSRFRKWRSSPRPSISRRDERAIARADSARKALKTLGKKAGLKVTG